MVDNERLTLELGITGSSSYYDDPVQALSGRQAITTWRKMLNDSTVSAIMYAISMMIRSVEWSVLDGEDVQARRNSDFLREQIAHLTHPFSDIPQQAVEGCAYGFSFHEITYRLDAGMVGWESITLRPQHTLLKWVLDEKNRPEVFIQMLPRGGTAHIPVPVKGFLFRTDTTSPSGVSILRGAWQSWRYKTRAEEALMIGVDRDLRGTPVIKMPSDVLAAGEGNAYYDAMKDIVTRMKRDEQMGLLMPSDRDSDGNLIYEFSLVTDGPGDYTGAASVIRMYAQDIATTVLATFLGLGRDTTGSRALAEPQQELFRIALNALVDMVQDAMNRQLVDTLFDLNPHLAGERPRIVHTPITDVDLEQLGSFITDTFRAGADWFTDDPDDPTMARVRELAGIDADTTR